MVFPLPVGSRVRVSLDSRTEFIHLVVYLEKNRSPNIFLGYLVGLTYNEYKNWELFIINLFDL